MANDSFSQQALANDSYFRTRLRGLMIEVAFEFLAEVGSGNQWQGRQNYARRVLDASANEVDRVAPIIVTRTNLFSFATNYNFADGRITTASGDADIKSQLHSDWNLLAGV